MTRAEAALRRAVRALVGTALLAGGALLPLSGQTPEAPTAKGSGATSHGSPVPVLLVPGWSDEGEVLEPLAERFGRAGWPEPTVLPLSFADPVGSNLEHALEIARAVDSLREATGAPRVDVVAHSMGGLATRRYLLNGGHEHVRRVVFLATPHDGTLSAYLAWGEGAREMEPGSAFLLGLERGRPVPGRVRAITIRTPLDLHVLPAENATLPGLPNLTVCCPTHAGLLDDDETFELIERFLGDER